MREEIRAFIYIDEYNCVHTIYGVDYYDALKNYEESLEFTEEDD